MIVNIISIKPEPFKNRKNVNIFHKTVQKIHANTAPAAVGPYSQAMVHIGTDRH